MTTPIVNRNAQEGLQEAFKKFMTPSFQDTLRNITTANVEEVEEVYMDLYGNYDSLTDLNKEMVKGLVTQSLTTIIDALKKVDSKKAFNMKDLLNTLTGESSAYSNNENVVNKNNNVNMSGGRHRKNKSRRKTRKTRRRNGRSKK